MNAIINQNSIGVYLNGALRTINKEHPHFEEIKAAIKINDSDEVEKLIDKTETINEYGRSKIYVENGQIKYNGKVLDNHLTRRLTSLMEEGFGVDNLVAFIENLYQNPNEESINELYDFLEHFALPITEDGCFLAYKAVTNDYLDIYSRTISNKIGDEPFVDRIAVDSNRYIHCSAGLHVGAIGYVKSYGHCYRKPEAGYGNRIMIVKVNPRDAVSVPNDCSCQKLRTCRYKVIAELADYDKILERAVYTAEAEEKQSDCNTYNSIPKYKVEPKTAEPDSVFFDGRRDGELDGSAGIPYQYQNNRTKKYNRGYKNGYRKVGFNIK